MTEDEAEYIEPQDFAGLLYAALRSDANPEQRDEAARKACFYVADLLRRVDELEEAVSNLPEPLDPEDFVIRRRA
jgi:hypothetical protein